ncbi:hypothetical protein CHKEEEPN_1305 [Methylorubrum podarium]|nr:hypothetical protein CHKEEEPN_1305 [Methylorubrum podarium]
MDGAPGRGRGSDRGGRAARTAGDGDRGPALRRDPARQFRTERRPADRGALSRHRPHRRLDRHGHRGHAVLRSHARQDHRHRCRPVGRHRGAPGGARPDRRFRHRDQPRLPAHHRRLRPLRERPGGDDGPARSRIPPQQHRGAAARPAIEPAGAARPAGPVGGRRAAERADGCPLLPPRQRPGRQRPGHLRPRTDRLRPDAPLPRGRSGGAGGRRDAAHPRRRAAPPRRGLPGQGGTDARRRRDRGAGPARLSGPARRFFRAGRARFPRHLRARRLRRPRHRGAEGRRRAPSRRRADGGGGPARARAADACLGDRRRLRPARGAGLLPGGRHRRPVLGILRGALQLGPHRRAADRPDPALGPQRRRRGGAPPFEPARQRLRRRRHRLHRRHADPARPRRPEPRRLRLPGRHRPRRIVEDGPTPARRHRAVPAGGTAGG